MSEATRDGSVTSPRQVSVEAFPGRGPLPMTEVLPGAFDLDT